jgi:flagellar hook-basal body complex protein FliE
MSSLNSIQNIKPYSIAPKGDKIDIKVTDPRHYGKDAEIKNIDDVSESFAATLKNALQSVNDQQIRSDELTQKMIVNPNSVDAHEVMIAAEKARISLTFTKTLVDGVIKAYRELSNLR